MFKSKIREQEVTKGTEDKFYETVFLIVAEKTAENTQELIKKWAEFAGTNEQLLQTAMIKLSLSRYSHMKYFKMRALAYFGVSIKDIKNVFGITANYSRMPTIRVFNEFTTCNDEELAEIRKTLDRLIYFLWTFKYVKFDENGIVLKDYKEYNKQRICETYFRTSLFYFRQRYKNIFDDVSSRPLVAMAKLLNMTSQELEFLTNKINMYNRANMGEMRSLLYYAFGISIKDAKILIPHTQQSMNALHRKYEDRTYRPILSENEFEVVKKFLRNIYENTKYINCLKGVDKNE